MLPAIRIFLALTLLTGVVYPLVVTGAARVLFPRQATGSVVEAGGKAVGSELLAQPFADAKYFLPRPSASDPAYATVASGASNLGPTAEKQQKAVAERAAALRERFGIGPDAPLPADLLTASGSGLDPHLTPEAARFQVAAVAKARGFDAAKSQRLRELVESSVEPPQLGFLGEPRINVLRLNLAVDRL